MMICPTTSPWLFWTMIWKKLEEHYEISLKNQPLMPLVSGAFVYLLSLLQIKAPAIIEQQRN